MTTNYNPRELPFKLLDDPETPSQREHDADTLRKVHCFIRDRVIMRSTSGKLPDAKTIAARLIVLELIIDPATALSLRCCAKELGCTPAWLSKIAVSFSAALGIRAPWQRPESAKIYSERAQSVHAGTHVASAKWERRKIRESKRERA